MAVVFSVRGNSYNARRSGGYPNGTAYNSAQISIGAGDLGSVIDLSNAAVVKYVAWSGAKNTPNSRTMSVLVRFAPNYTGTPAASRAILEVDSGTGGTGANFVIFHATTTGNFTVTGRNQAGQNTFSSVNFGVWAPTQAQYYDMVWKWNGTTSAGAGSVTIDNSVLGTATASNALATDWGEQHWKAIAIGATAGLTTSQYFVSEIVIWDELIDTSAVLLDNGTTSALSGTTRVSYVAATPADGSASTGTSNILKTQLGRKGGW